MKDYIGLNLGCGPNILEGWLNTDIEPIDDRVVYLDAGKPFPFEDETFDFIFSEHMFEHLTYKEGKNMLSECYRVLRRDGVLRLSLPTLDNLIELYEHRHNKDAINYVEWSLQTFDKSGCIDDQIGFNTCFVINNFFHLWGHKMIYDRDVIYEMLRREGFREVFRENNNISHFNVLIGVNGHAKQIGELFNDIETTTFEAQK